MLLSLGVVSHDSGVKDTLEKFLSSSMEFYSKLPSIVESQLSFKVSELVHNGVQCSSKTHWRKVRVRGWQEGIGGYTNVPVGTGHLLS